MRMRIGGSEAFQPSVWASLWFVFEIWCSTFFFGRGRKLYRHPAKISDEVNQQLAVTSPAQVLNQNVWSAASEVAERGLSRLSSLYSGHRAALLFYLYPRISHRPASLVSPLLFFFFCIHTAHLFPSSNSQMGKGLTIRSKVKPITSFVAFFWDSSARRSSAFSRIRSPPGCPRPTRTAARVL